jgi:hypothetical protein
MYLLLGVAGAAIALAACSSPTTVCAGVQIVRSTLPDTTTIKVGAATIAIGGESYGWCGAPANTHRRGSTPGTQPIPVSRA